MSFTKHIFIYVLWQISVKCIFIRGEEIFPILENILRNKLWQYFVVFAAMSDIASQVLVRAAGSGSESRDRPGAGENLRRSGLQLLVLFRGKITCSLNLALDFESCVYLFQNDRISYIDLTIWIVNYSYLTFFIGKQYYATALNSKILTFIERWTAGWKKIFSIFR